MNTAEKIETIILARESGTLGTFIEYVPGKFRVVADGLTVLVRCGAVGWHVSFKGMESIDPELYAAAKMSLDEGRHFSVSRNFDLGAWDGGAL